MVYGKRAESGNKPLSLADIATRIEQAVIHGAPTWELEYWEGIELREVDRINRDRLGNLALRTMTHQATD